MTLCVDDIRAGTRAARSCRARAETVPAPLIAMSKSSVGGVPGGLLLVRRRDLRRCRCFSTGARFGLRIFAIGGNAQSAELSGVARDRAADRLLRAVLARRRDRRNLSHRPHRFGRSDDGAAVRPRFGHRDRPRRRAAFRRRRQRHRRGARNDHARAHRQRHEHARRLAVLSRGPDRRACCSARSACSGGRRSAYDRRDRQDDPAVSPRWAEGRRRASFGLADLLRRHRGAARLRRACAAEPAAAVPVAADPAPGGAARASRSSASRSAYGCFRSTSRSAASRWRSATS